MIPNKFLDIFLAFRGILAVPLNVGRDNGFLRQLFGLILLSFSLVVFTTVEKATAAYCAPLGRGRATGAYSKQWI